MALSNEPVTVICYGKEKQFNSRQEAYDYYKQGVLETDGSEQSRYATICTMLLSSNDKIVGDDEYYDTMAAFKEMTCKIVADYIKKILMSMQILILQKMILLVILMIRTMLIMSINDYKEKEYECMALVKNHTELFTYDKQNDIYYSKMFNVSIGNKRKLQEEIERHCKSDSDKNKLGKLVEDYSSKDILCAIYNSKGGCGVYPIAMVFESKDIENQIEQLHQHQMNDKYINGTVEAQYDNYLSVEEEADMAESKTATTIPDFDIDLERGDI